MKFCRKQAHAPCSYSFTYIAGSTLARRTPLTQTTPFILNIVDLTVTMATEQISESNLVNKTNLVDNVWMTVIHTE